MRARMLALVSTVLALACAGATAPASHPVDERAHVERVLDAWHAAAAASDEATYFDHLAEDAVFLGTDATERWSRDQLRAYAHPRFAAGRGWVLRPVRRDTTVDHGSGIAWFDEDLDGLRLGPARGSGVLRRDASGRWRIVQYVLSLTIPNERFGAVRCVLTDGAADGCAAPEGATRPEVEALRQRLDAARSPAAIFALGSPERGIEFDLAHSIGHLARTACTVEDVGALEAELDGYASDFGLETLPLHHVLRAPRLACSRDGTRCVSCSEDLSDCQDATLYELAPGADGALLLYGIVTSFALALPSLSSPPRHVDDLVGQELGQATEVGVKCALRRQLLEGRLSEVRLEEPSRTPPRVRVLRGAGAAGLARTLGALMDLGAYCGPEHCVLEAQDGTYGVYYRRIEDGSFEVPVVTFGEPECDGCAPAPMRGR